MIVPYSIVPQFFAYTEATNINNSIGYPFPIPGQLYSSANAVAYDLQMTTAPVYKRRMVNLPNQNGQIDLDGIWQKRDIQPCTITYTLAASSKTTLEIEEQKIRHYARGACTLYAKITDFNVTDRSVGQTFYVRNVQIDYSQRRLNVAKVTITGDLKPYWFDQTLSSHVITLTDGVYGNNLANTVLNLGNAPIVEAAWMNIVPTAGKTILGVNLFTTGANPYTQSDLSNAGLSYYGHANAVPPYCYVTAPKYIRIYPNKIWEMNLDNTFSRDLTNAINRYFQVNLPSAYMYTSQIPFINIPRKNVLANTLWNSYAINVQSVYTVPGGTATCNIYWRNTWE